MNLPVPRQSPVAARLISHSTLRLVAQTASFAPLWNEQVAAEWREPTPPCTWPVLGDVDERWRVRAVVDAIVAAEYGLTREQYAHVLATFSHRSYPRTPSLCLAAFDEAHAIGMDAFVRKHDPYWNVPLNEGLPDPVIDLAIRVDDATQLQSTFDSLPEALHVAEGDGSTNPPATARPSRSTQAAGNEDCFETLRTLVAERGTISSADAQVATGLVAADLRPYLKRLVDEGHARVEGKARGTRYVRIESEGGGKR